MRFYIAILLLSAVASVTAQSIPRTEDGKPNLQGIWQAQGSAAYGLEAHAASQNLKPALGAVETGLIPYQTWARKQQQENLANRTELDPLNKCHMPGVPRIMYMEYPFNIWQTKEHVAMTFEWTQVFRLLYTSGQQSKYPALGSYMGDSRGRWEDDVLVVEVTNHNNGTWFDASGNFHSADLHLTERYRMLDADTIEYHVTVKDPKVFTRPWSMRILLERQHDMARILEYQCQAEAEVASGDFERDERTWYPASIPVDNEAFDANAGADIPLPAVPDSNYKLNDDTPEIGGYYETDNGGTNYGFETAFGRPLVPNSRGVLIDPIDGLLPYQRWARAEQRDREFPHRGYDDPTAHCIVAGLPRSHYVPAPYFILQPPGHVVILHERMSYRVIYLNRDELLPDSIRLYQGDSIGRWEDHTLVVNSANFNGRTWLNEIGDVISHAQTLVETFTPVSDSQLIYRATISDPIAYTRPWTIELPLNQLDEELLEVACLETNNDLEQLRHVRDEWRAKQVLEN